MQSLPTVLPGTHNSQVSGITGQKIVFPPPVIRSSVPLVSNLVGPPVSNGYTSYTNFKNVPLHMQTESIYVPVTNANPRPNVNISVGNNPSTDETNRETTKD